MIWFLYSLHTVNNLTRDDNYLANFLLPAVTSLTGEMWYQCFWFGLNVQSVIRLNF